MFLQIWDAPVKSPDRNRTFELCNDCESLLNLTIIFYIVYALTMTKVMVLFANFIKIFSKKID